MRHAAVAAQVEVPPVVVGIQVLLAHPLFQDVEPFLPLAAADAADLADRLDEILDPSAMT